MSVSPSLPPGGPTVAELLLQRTFARPPRPFVDADVILALSAAAHDHAVVAEPPAGQRPRLDVRA